MSIKRYKASSAARGLLAYDGIQYALFRLLTESPKAQGNALAFVRAALYNPVKNNSHVLANETTLTAIKPALLGVEAMLEEILDIKHTSKEAGHTEENKEHEPDDVPDSDDDPTLF